MKKSFIILILLLFTSLANAILITNDNNSNIIYFVFRDQTAGTVDTGVTVTNIDCYYIEDGALISAKFDVTAHANGDDPFDDEEGFHMGFGVYRIDFPDIAFDGGVGKRVQLIAIDGDGGAFTEIMEVELSAPVNTVAVAAGAITATAIANAAIDNATFAADVGSTAYATNIIALAADKAGLNGVNVIQLGGVAQSLADLKDFADAGYNPATDKVTGVLLTDTVTTYTGNTKQTGDNFAIVNGASGLVAINTDVEAILDDTGTSGVVIGADAITAAKIADDAFAAEHFATNSLTNDALAASWVTEIWAIAMSDLAAGAPSATASVHTAINYLYEAWRNVTTTGPDGAETEITIFKNDGTTPLVESVVSDDDTTFTRGEMGAPD